MELINQSMIEICMASPMHCVERQRLNTLGFTV